jgi:hypothetical protein
MPYDDRSLDNQHSQKWRLCPACGHKLQHHRDSMEVWNGRTKQLVHRRGSCYRKFKKQQRQETP